MKIQITEPPRTVYENGRIKVVDMPPLRRLLVSGVCQTQMMIEEPNGPGLEYTDEFMRVVRYKGGIRTICCLGVGGGTVIKHAINQTDAKVCGVDNNPEMVDLGAKWFSLPTENSKLTIHICDAKDFFLSGLGRGQYDFVYQDVFHADLTPFHLTTLEWFLFLNYHMTRDGYFLVHILGERTARRVRRNVLGAFPLVLEKHTKNPILPHNWEFLGVKDAEEDVLAMLTYLGEGWREVLPGEAESSE